MHRQLGFLFCAVTALAVSSHSSVTRADTLSVIAPSNLSVSVGVGVFVDDEGNGSNPITNDPYGPGDINPDDGNPVSFFALGTSVGQGNPSVPPTVLLPGGILPITSDGSNASANGTVSVTPGGFTIDSGSIGLNDSGLWQPGNGTDTTAPPVLAPLGAYIDLGGVIAGEYVLATLSGLSISLNTSGPLALDGLGNFTDPNGTVNLQKRHCDWFCDRSAELVAEHHNHQPVDCHDVQRQLLGRRSDFASYGHDLFRSEQCSPRPLGSGEHQRYHRRDCRSRAGHHRLGRPRHARPDPAYASDAQGLRRCSGSS